MSDHDETPTLPEVKALEEPPTDGITGLFYLGQKPLVASTSWDGSVRVHETTSRALLLSHLMQSGPLLSLAVHRDARFLFCGGLDGSVRKLDVETSIDSLLGRHESTNHHDKPACSCVSAVGEHLVLSAGWHKQLHLWDTRLSNNSAATAAAAFTVALPGKAFAMDVDPHTQTVAAVATSGRRFCFYDIRRNDPAANTAVQEAELLLDRESSLKYQTRCLRFFPDGGAIAVGSIEGRAAVEYLEDLGREAKGKKFAFKCHRVGDLCYPVNAIEHHPRFSGTFATAGCDGSVVLWDGLNKKKISTLPMFPSSVAAMAFNHDGTELAVAASYTFEEGEREHAKDEIYIRPMLDFECAPKG